MENSNLLNTSSYERYPMKSYSSIKCLSQGACLTHLMDSSTVCLCSAAFRRICSRMMSALSRSTLARAFASASTRNISFLCRSSISCSTVAEKVKDKGIRLVRTQFQDLGKPIISGQLKGQTFITAHTQ